MNNLFLLCLTLYFTSGCLAQTLSPKNYTRWFNQTLDHFDNQSLNTWKQRYFVNDEYLDQNKRNVAFLFIEGQREATDIWMTEGQWQEYARDSNAILFELELRFFGESRPTADVSVDNLRYLTTEQVLADLAEFVVSMNKEYNLSKEVKWIAFGDSTYTAYLRSKYPHVIAGAVSSSEPLLALLDYPGYFEIVADDLRDTDENCLSAVQAGTSQIAARLQNKAGAATLTSLFQLCSPLEEVIDNEDEISSFYSTLSDNIAFVAQNNKVNRFSVRNTPLANITLDTICDIMTDVSKQEIDRLASVNSLMLNGFGDSCVFYSYSDTLIALRNESWAAALGGRQELYQLCNEYGFFQTSTVELGFGDIPLKWYIKKCTDVFGPQFNETHLNQAIEKTNLLYGGLDIEVDNVAFVQGSMDPWSRLGITNTTNPNSPAIFIEGAAHCADVYPASDKNLPQLKAALLEIGRLIKTWLNL